MVSPVHCAPVEIGDNIIHSLLLRLIYRHRRTHTRSTPLRAWLLCLFARQRPTYIIEIPFYFTKATFQQPPITPADYRCPRTECTRFKNSSKNSRELHESSPANGRRSPLFSILRLLLRLPVSRERPRDSGSCPVQLSPFRPAGPFRSLAVRPSFAERRTRARLSGESSGEYSVGTPRPGIPYSSRGRPSTKRNSS